MRKNLKIKIIVLLLLATGVISTGFSCKWVTPAEKELLAPVELTWWGVHDDSDNFSEIIQDYRSIHPHISITYRELRPEEFEQKLLEALAEDRGPDIFTIHNTWLTKYLPKIESLPAKITMAYESKKKSLGLKEETIIEIKENPSITTSQLKNDFIDVVYNDVVRNSKIYGLPLSVDTLVLLFNRDLLNNAGIPLPPTNWLTLQENVKRLTYQDKNSKLIQSGIALGLAENIEHSIDILSLLMMQNGADMTIGNQVTFGLIPSSFPDRTYNPGLEALRFYTDFADQSKEVYTWNETFPNSIDAFVEGRVAMIFAYNYHIPYIEAKRQGKLNYGITKVPQIEGRSDINFASYWLQVVSKKSEHINEAWDFIQFISRSNEAKKYLTKTSKPTALRSLILEQKDDGQLQVFADQLLTSTSWYKGKDAIAMENSFEEMIDLIHEGLDVRKVIELAIQKIQQTF